MTVKDVEEYYQGVVKRQDGNINVLKNQNAELLEMLKTCKNCFSDPWFTKSRAENMAIAIQKMIAKAEGK